MDKEELTSCFMWLEKEFLMGLSVIFTCLGFLIIFEFKVFNRRCKPSEDRNFDLVCSLPYPQCVEWHFLYIACLMNICWGILNAIHTFLLYIGGFEGMQSMYNEKKANVETRFRVQLWALTGQLSVHLFSQLGPQP